MEQLLMEQLRDIPLVPSVQMSDASCNSLVMNEEFEEIQKDEDENENYDLHYTRYQLEKIVERDDELVSESSDVDHGSL